jgi:hypothetical protein
MKYSTLPRKIIQLETAGRLNLLAASCFRRFDFIICFYIIIFLPRNISYASSVRMVRRTPAGAFCPVGQNKRRFVSVDWRWPPPLSFDNHIER